MRLFSVLWFQFCKPSFLNLKGVTFPTGSFFETAGAWGWGVTLLGTAGCSAVSLGTRCHSEKAMAPHSSTLAWKVSWTEEPGRLQSTGSLRVSTTERLHFHFSLLYTEGNGNPLQCSCLENPRDGGAWWAAVYGVAQSRTRLT